MLISAEPCRGTIEVDKIIRVLRRLPVVGSSPILVKRRKVWDFPLRYNRSRLLFLVTAILVWQINLGLTWPTISCLARTL